MIEDVTPEIADMVVRAIRDPMIGGWPLIHWEWVFSSEWEDAGALQRHGRGIAVTGEYPDSDDRQVILRYHPTTGTPDHDLAGH